MSSLNSQINWIKSTHDFYRFMATVLKIADYQRGTGSIEFA